MRLLLIGDIVGKGGRMAVRHLVPALREEFGCSFCIANGENSAGGAGMTEKCVREILDAGVDVITTGDHVWDQKEFEHQIANYPAVLRPANFPPAQPGRGYGVFQSPDGTEIAVIDLIGRVFVNAQSDNPFTAADRILEDLKQRQVRNIFVDIHAEATSEKIAIGRYLEGRVTAVWGTHTHVQTADERVLPKGTAFICDLGMVGSQESILGRDIRAVIHRMSTGMPRRFKVVDTDVLLCGAVVEFDPTSGRATGIERIARMSPS